MQHNLKVNTPHQNQHSDTKHRLATQQSLFLDFEGGNQLQAISTGKR